MVFKCGERPIWEMPLFRHLVLGNSLAKDPSELAPAPAQGTPLLRTLIDALVVVSAQLEALEKFGYAAPALRRTVGRVHAAFARSLELCRMLPQVRDNATFYELLTTFTAQVKALMPGGILVIPGGWAGGVTVYVLHCVSYESYTLAICSTGSGLQYHPTRIDPATGAVQYNTPLLLLDIPPGRVRDSAIWFILIRAALFPDKNHSASLIYEKLLPYLLRRPPRRSLRQARRRSARPRRASGDRQARSTAEGAGSETALAAAEEALAAAEASAALERLRLGTRSSGARRRRRRRRGIRRRLAATRSRTGSPLSRRWSRCR